MSKKQEKNVMDSVIEDIATAVDEAVVEAEAEQAAAVEMIAEAASQQETPPGVDTIVVKFDDDLAAARAVRVINKALRKRKDTIYQGAVVSRKNEDDYEVEDMRDMGLSDVITGTAGIGIALGRDGFKLVWSAARSGLNLISSGFRLLRRTALASMGLAGATWTIPSRRRLDDYDEAGAQSTATALEPGSSAVVIVADRETAAELATDLVRSGGELV